MDISGRHEESGEYLMVSAAVHASVGTARLRNIEGMGFATSDGHTVGCKYVKILGRKYLFQYLYRPSSVIRCSKNYSRQYQPTFENTARVVADAVAELPEPPEGPVVAEHGEFYEEPEVRVEQFLGPRFKYVESIAERKTVQTAHHAAYAARKLFL